MIKKLTLITILLFGNIAFSQEPKLIEKYLFATLKGKIDDKYDITINIQIFDVYSLAGGMTVELTGNYHYDKFGKNIYFTKGTINKNSMIIEAEGDEFFNFKLDEATLKKILEFKNITINGNWENKSKKFPCVINNISPLGGKLSEIYEYGIPYDDYLFGYQEQILYSPSINVSYFDKDIEKIDTDTLKKIIKEKLKLKKLVNNKVFIDDGYLSSMHYFDNKILCIEDYFHYAVNQYFHDYNIISLETGKKLNNTLEYLVNYNDKFVEFIKKEFIEYHKNITKLSNFYDNYDFDLPEQSRESKFIFNNDGTITIYNDYFPFVNRGYDLLTIDMKKLKPYIKKDSFYRYLFD